MDYQSLASVLPKQTATWTADDVGVWLRSVSLSELVNVFTEKQVDGSVLKLLDNKDLEEELRINSSIIRKKIMAWVKTGFDGFDAFLKKIVPEKVVRPSTEVLRDKIKPQLNLRNRTEHEDATLYITTYEGDKSRFYTVNRSGAILGSLTTCQIPIKDEGVEPNHAEIYYDGSEFNLADLGSIQGTFVKVSQKFTLTLKTIIEIGSFLFTVVGMNVPRRSLQLLGTNTMQQESEKYFRLHIVLSLRDHFTFGRRETNDFSRNDHHMSNTHAKIYFSKDRFILEDISSTNGTWIRLSDVRVRSRPYRLEDKSIFKIGSTSTYICQLQRPGEPKQLNSTLRSKCSVCNNEPADMLYLPCKHKVDCAECSQSSVSCSFCGEPVEEKIKLYL